ncbi:MAG: hypothetical protein OEV30_09805 [Ignavibacteria bacterium]|nr:hypothetical protein [Ignavibacteria bacterium]
MTLFGWIIVFAGFGSLFLGWRLGLPHGLIDLLLSAGTIAAGLLVVQQAVVSLEEYIAVPFGVNRVSHPAFDEIGTLMSDMARGGWREARRGAAELERIAARYGLTADVSTTQQR